MPIVMYASDFRILTGTQKFEECRSAKPPELSGRGRCYPGRCCLALGRHRPEAKLRQIQTDRLASNPLSYWFHIRHEPLRCLHLVPQHCRRHADSVAATFGCAALPCGPHFVCDQYLTPVRTGPNHIRNRWFAVGRCRNTVNTGINLRTSAVNFL